MNKKQRFLKNLLTTASVLAVTAMPASQASGVDITVAAPGAVSTGNAPTTAARAGGGNVADHDTITFTNVAATIRIGDNAVAGGGNVAATIIDSINLGGFAIAAAPDTIKVTGADVSIGSIGNANAGNPAGLTVTSANTLTLTGTKGTLAAANDYSGLGNVTLGMAGST